MAGLVSLGRLRFVKIRCGMAGLVWQGKVGLGPERTGTAGNFKTKEEIMVYQWNPASRIKTDANVAGKVFEELQSTVGLTAKTLLDASRPEEAPLHSEFEWDDAKAAESYRETQASYIIRSLCVHADGDKQEPVRAVFALSGSAGYESVSVIMEDVDKRSSLLDMALKELSAFEKKYRILEELSEVFAAADRVIGQK